MPSGLLSQVCHTTCGSSSFLTAAPMSFTMLHSFALHSFLIHRYFISARFSTLRCPYCCARRACHRLRYGALLAQSHANASMPHKAPPLCAHHGLTAILLCAPVAGTRRSTSVHSFLIHSSAR